MTGSQYVQANKVTTWNGVTRMEETEICNNERFAQLKGFPFITVKKVEQVQAEQDHVCEMGGVTPAFRRMWESIK